MASIESCYARPARFRAEPRYEPMLLPALVRNVARATMPVQPLHTLRTHTVWGAWVAMPDFFDLLPSLCVAPARSEALITCVLLLLLHWLLLRHGRGDNSLIFRPSGHDMAGVARFYSVAMQVGV